MTRKDYILAANIIRNLAGPWASKQKVINSTAKIFAKDNPRFDKKRFVEACK